MRSTYDKHLRADHATDYNKMITKVRCMSTTRDATKNVASQIAENVVSQIAEARKRFRNQLLIRKRRRCSAPNVAEKVPSQRDTREAAEKRDNNIADSREKYIDSTEESDSEMEQRSSSESANESDAVFIVADDVTEASDAAYAVSDDVIELHDTESSFGDDESEDTCMETL